MSRHDFTAVPQNGACFAEKLKLNTSDALMGGHVKESQTEGALEEILCPGVGFVLPGLDPVLDCRKTTLSLILSHNGRPNASEMSLQG